MHNTIKFIDLDRQQVAIRPAIDAAIKKILDQGTYIMGKEIFSLEADLAKFCGVKHAIVCSNGTDALALGLRAKGIGPGDAVFVPNFTFAATAEVVAWLGATPVFIDVLADTFNMSPQSLEAGIHLSKKLGLSPKAIIPVDLFGQPADYDALEPLAKAYGLWILADGAQSFGATYKGRKVGSIGEIATTSFFPAKPLGCYGDGGAVFTDDDDVAACIKSLRIHGQGEDRYDNIRVGINGRMDTLQAAILIEKLKIFPTEIKSRNVLASFYNEHFKDLVHIPCVVEGAQSTWAQYTIVLPEGLDRHKLMDRLSQAGVPTMVYYKKPLHLQKAYASYPSVPLISGENVGEALVQRVLSLPMHGYVREDEAYFIVEMFKKALKASLKS